MKAGGCVCASGGSRRAGPVRAARRIAPALALLVLLPAGHPPAAGNDSGRVETRFGSVSLEVDPGDDHRFLLAVNGNVLRRDEGLQATLVQYESGESYQSSESRDFVLVEIQSGGIACPFQYAVVETAKSHAPAVSGTFGSCGEMEQADVRGEAFIVTIGPYVPHPELLPPAERRRASRTRTVYTWSQGRLSERNRVSK